MVFRRKSLAVSWLLSYIAVLLVPVVVSSIVFWHIRGQMEEKAENVNRTLLANAASTLDDAIGKIVGTAMHMKISPSLRIAAYINAPLGPTDHYQLYRTALEMRAVAAGNEYVRDYYVVFGKTGYVMSGPSVYSPSIREAMIVGDGLLSPQEWTGILNNHVGGFHFLAGGRVLYIVDLGDSGGRTETPSSFVILFVDNPLLFRVVDRIRESTSMSFLLADSNGSALLLTDDFAKASAPAVGTAFRSGDTQFQVDGNDYVFVSERSDYSFNYFLMDRASVFYREITGIRWLFGATLLVCLLLGGFAAVFFTIRSYRPIHNLVMTTSQKLGLVRDLSGNEYGVLLATVDVALDQIEKANVSLRRNRELVWTDTLVKLLRGIATPDESTTVEMSEPCYAVALCRLEPVNHGPQPQSRRDVIRRIIQDFLRRTPSRHLVEIDDMFCVILGAPGCESNDTATVREEIGKLHETLRTVPGLDACLSLSRTHEGLGSLHVSYSEAREAMEYRIVHGPAAVIDYESIRDVVSSYSYPAEREHSLMNLIKHGDSRAAREIAAEVVSRNTEHGTLSAQLARCLMFDLISTVIKTLSEISLESRYLTELKPVDRLIACETLPEMERTIGYIIDSVCERIRDRNRSAEARIVEDMCGHIDAHFGDVLLNLEAIAGTYELAPVALSRLFREHAGMSVGDYINRRRIECAIRMLRDTDEPVSVLATTCGYGSTHTFIRVFKKNEGLSPGRYRDTVRGA